MKIVLGTQSKFTARKYNDKLGRPYSKKDLYLCKPGKTEKKNCTSENWFEGVINPNAMHDSKIFTETFFYITLTNQDGNFELESSTNYEKCVSSERLENAKPAVITSTVP